MDRCHVIGVDQHPCHPDRIVELLVKNLSVIPDLSLQLKAVELAAVNDRYWQAVPEQLLHGARFHLVQMDPQQSSLLNPASQTGQTCRIIGNLIAAQHNVADDIQSVDVCGDVVREQFHQTPCQTQREPDADRKFADGGLY